jgi:hypothetical protein
MGCMVWGVGGWSQGSVLFLLLLLEEEEEGGAGGDSGITITTGSITITCSSILFKKTT